MHGRRDARDEAWVVKGAGVMAGDGGVNEPIRVGVLLYPGVEELDFCGPYEVFKAAGLEARRLRGAEGVPLTVFTVAETTDLVSTSGDLLVRPHYSFVEHPRIDVLVVPGGNATGALQMPALMAWLEGTAARTRLNASVCTGAFLLGKLGLLEDIAATTHWASLDRLAAAHPTTEVRRDVRWVDAGAVVTSAGISAGIDMSLHLVERLVGRDVALATARFMEYDWQER
jgi:transcriptional regulator GlxA family with amidase domain